MIIQTLISILTKNNRYFGFFIVQYVDCIE